MDRMEAALADRNAKRMLQLLPWILRAADAWQVVTAPVRRLRRRRAGV
jgi:hypothetical protein